MRAAQHRNEWVFCRDSIVEHLHPNWGKADMDATYEIALDGEAMAADRELFAQRKRIWRGGRVVASAGRRRG